MKDAVMTRLLSAPSLNHALKFKEIVRKNISHGTHSSQGGCFGLSVTLLGYSLWSDIWTHKSFLCCACVTKCSQSDDWKRREINFQVSMHKVSFLPSFPELLFSPSPSPTLGNYLHLPPNNNFSKPFLSPPPPWRGIPSSSPAAVAARRFV